MTGNDNTAIGRIAGHDLTSGTFNNFIGYFAGANATTASNTIAIGKNAISLGVLTGDNNVAIGNGAGTDLTSGGSNAFVGYIAGGNVTTGANNTIFGTNAGISLTTGSNNTIIGHDAAPTSATVSNEITLGNASITDVRIPGVGFYIDNGKVGIGTSSPSDLLDLSSADPRIRLTNTGGGYCLVRTGSTDGSLILDADAGNTAANSDIIMRVDGTESMRIDSLGNVGIGTTATVGSNSTGEGFWFDENEAARFSRASNSCSILNRITTTGPIQLIRYNGSGVGSISVTASSTAYNTSSDYRLKENVVGLGEAIDRVKLLKPSRFNFIADPDTTVDGFVAHEVSDIVPEAVTGTKDAMRDEEYEVTPAVLDEDGNEVTPAVIGTRSVPDYQGIDQSKLVPLLTAALQEALTEINDLKARVTALEG